jgi:hypothetical protein
LISKVSKLKQIKTLLQNAPRDADKLERLLKVRERQKDEAMYMEDTQRLMTEIEMLKVVLCIWSAAMICARTRKDSEREEEEKK